ncbi:MAG: Arsenate reductase (EC [uncultured Aureispira sp.]|uniref:Arsenate reductase (EC) n=1 Tax=uncultured Aureispira sp. TaxID=1331704 RepID=A0A6S6UEE8_9BACT|nr:MAG: Arsenate reductase (EC [uncultured Aureispira sp.]
MSAILPTLALYCQQLEQKFNQISPARKQVLLVLSHYLMAQIKEGKTPAVTVICTHNSRRSHLAQLWLAIAADYYQTPEIATFSGGTQISAFNPRTIVALQEIGLKITSKNPSIANPIYDVSWTDKRAPYLAFSKQYTHPSNPQNDFLALVVCAHADLHCPIITGSALKLALPYQDPKAFDNSPLEAAEYAKTCALIGLEMLFVLKQLQP